MCDDRHNSNENVERARRRMAERVKRENRVLTWQRSLCGRETIRHSVWMGFFLAIATARSFYSIRWCRLLCSASLPMPQHRSKSFAILSSRTYLLPVVCVGPILFSHWVCERVSCVNFIFIEISYAKRTDTTVNRGNHTHLIWSTVLLLLLLLHYCVCVSSRCLMCAVHVCYIEFQTLKIIKK